ncbi:maestro heat-like repeat-containing protein family member 9 [Apodemus sylvaticus]|uniref:maestro heat-like repeat-containing protein family member 9 n=1 Tax=Apodemus sylvaticus TaxID=10129 RepID=UPI002242A2FA|nr:maestro heat-like repeat-containing protein family member 9 [Apodemus sylvaticus]
MAQESSNTMTRLQTLQSSVTWYHVEFKAEILLDTYSGLLSEQSMILAMNSSFVDPLMQFESQLRIIELSFKKVFSMPSLSTVKAMGRTSEDTEDLENLYQNIFNIFEDTLLILVSKDFYKIQILKEMATWMSEDCLYQQERAMMVITRVLIFASKRVKKYPSIDAPCLGLLAAELSLFCSHSDPEIIQQAMASMNYVLYIGLCQNSNVVKFKSSKPSEEESNIKIITSDIESLAKMTQGEKAKIAQSVGQILLPQLLTDFVWTLLKKLSSSNNKVAIEAASLLKLTLEFHAQKITRVSKIVDDVYEQLCGNSAHMMKGVMLRVISLLTRASPKKVIFQLMEFPVPADKTLLLMWQAASMESSVASEVLKTILSILKGRPGEMEETLGEKRRFSLDAANMMPVAASQALCTFLPVTSYKKVVVKLFPEFLMALLLQLFYCSQHVKDTAQDRPLYVRDALKALLNCSGLEEVDKALERKNFWDQFSQVMDHQYGIHLMAKTLSEYNFPQFPETLHYVYKVAVEGPRRSDDSIVTIIFFAELLNNFFKESLPEEFLVLFRNWINDSNPSVGKMSLQKIASMAPVFSEIESVCKLLLPVLDAFLSKEHTVIIRAMLTLRNILGKLDKKIYSTVCIRIASSYCPLMDHVNGGIQCMAIRHFGELLTDMSQYSWTLRHIVLGSLVPLILFLESKETRIVNACRYTLTVCVTQLKWSTACLLKDETYNFESVVLDICNNLLSSHESYITDLISDTLGFLGSSRAFLKKGAIILVGYLGKSGEHLLLREEIDIMIEVIERLTRSEDPLIKELAEKTRKLFKEMANRMASSTIKQTFRKWVKMFRTKKVKLIYDVANIINLEENIIETIKEDSLRDPNSEKSEEQESSARPTVQRFEYIL